MTGLDLDLRALAASGPVHFVGVGGAVRSTTRLTTSAARRLTAGSACPGQISIGR